MWQVIIQGLRESGVFSSVIESAQTRTPKEKFLLAIESNNNSGAIGSKKVISSRKIGNMREFQATRRTVSTTISSSPGWYLAHRFTQTLFLFLAFFSIFFLKMTKDIDIYVYSQSLKWSSWLIHKRTGLL